MSTIGVNRKLITIKEVDSLILEVIDETFKQIFKDPGTKAIYQYLEKECNLNKDDLAENPKEFSTSLRQLLGSAAPVIEILVIKKLYTRLGLDFRKDEDCSFMDYIEGIYRKCSA